ncbi:MAG: hypothetical protein KTR21_10365 [Rhodobacteraceae bacterium]|nr:hypothetical protein [Paracoccaceae bacterium]
MKIQGVPTLLSTRTQQALVIDTRLRIQDVQKETTTGLIANLSKSLRGDVGKVQRLDKLVADNERYQQSMELLATRFQTMQTVLSGVASRSNQIATEILGAVGLDDRVSLRQHTISAESEFNAVVSGLNTRIAGRALFSGAATDVAPIADANDILDDLRVIIQAAPDATTAKNDIATYFAAGGTFETTIYQGSTTPAPTTEVASGLRYGPDVSAIDDEIKDVLANLATLALAQDASSTDQMSDALLQSAGSDLLQSATQVINRQSSIGAVEEEIQLLLSRNQAETFAYEQSLAALRTRDQFEASVELQALTNQLEAVFVTTARIANLTYTNFIR